MLIGYARVSTEDQNLDLQRDALKAAGCTRIFEEKESGRAGTKRPALEAALDFLRTEDQLVVWKIDRLGRSLREMLDTAHMLQERGVKLRVSMSGLRSVEHVGGLDNWLAKTSDDKLSLKVRRLKREIAKKKQAEATA